MPTVFSAEHSRCSLIRRALSDSTFGGYRCGWLVQACLALLRKPQTKKTFERRADHIPAGAAPARSSELELESSPGRPACALQEINQRLGAGRPVYLGRQQSGQAIVGFMNIFDQLSREEK